MLVMLVMLVMLEILAMLEILIMLVILCDKSFDDYIILAMMIIWYDGDDNFWWLYYDDDDLSALQEKVPRRVADGFGDIFIKVNKLCSEVSEFNQLFAIKFSSVGSFDIRR